MIDYKGRGLGGHPGSFMAEVDADLARALRTAGRLQEFGRGDSPLVVRTLRPAGPVLVIREGFVAMVAEAADGRRTLLSIRGPGDLAGEWALFGRPGVTHGLIVRPLTDGSAWSVPQDRFRQVLERNPQGWEVLARTLQNRVDAAEERISLMAGASASQRLATFVLQLLTLKAPSGARRAWMVQVPLTQGELGEWIGATRETVERVLSGWVRRGAVRVRRRYLLVLDIAYLEKIAGINRPALPRTA
jgi:CRP-like cAMP-binding protein